MSVENVAVTVVVRLTFVELSGGVTDVTVGALLPVVKLHT
jgi:hypothetical protein